MLQGQVKGTLLMPLEVSCKVNVLLLLLRVKQLRTLRVTVHSLLKLPIGSRGNKDLIGQSLCRLQECVNDIENIIIDSYSMLG